MESQQITREKLYNMVWQQPISKLSVQFNLKDHELRQVCKDFNIPLPKSGHWQKVRYGKRPIRTPLPNVELDSNEINFKTIIEKRGTKTPVQTKLLTLIKEIEEDPQLPTKVPTKMHNPDPLIVEASQSLRNKRYNFHRSRQIFSTARGEIGIKVSMKNMNRALRIMNSLIKLFKARGYSIKIERETSYVVIDGESIEFRITEATTKVQLNDRWHSYEYRPTGILRCQATRWYEKEWKDGRLPLEKQLPRILAKIEMIAEKKKKERIERDKFWKKYKKKEKKRIKKEERKIKEQKRFMDLIMRARRWQQARDLRGYIEEIEQEVKSKGIESKKSTSWIQWAREKADWFDPLIKKKDKLLSNVDPNSFLVSRKD